MDGMFFHSFLARVFTDREVRYCQRSKAIKGVRDGEAIRARSAAAAGVAVRAAPHRTRTAEGRFIAAPCLSRRQHRAAGTRA